MKHLKTITIPPLTGERQIKSSNLFNYIDRVFNDCEIEIVKTEELKVDVLLLDENKIFGQIFTNPDKMCLTQDQILSFVENDRELLSKNEDTFFLFKNNNNFFVAHVRVRSDGLLVLRNRLDDSYGWYARYCHCVVVPQLAETSMPRPECFDPLKLEIIYDNIKYKLIRE